MAEVIIFPGITCLPIEPDRLLEAAQGKLESVVIVGFTKEGEFYFAASDPDGAETLWHLERAKHKLMQVTDDMENGDMGNGE